MAKRMGLGVLGIVLFACACRAASQAQSISFERFAADDLPLNHSRERQTAVVRSFYEWQCFSQDESLWTDAQALDWSHRMLVVVVLGERPATGYAVELDSVVQNESRWIVRAHEVPPIPDSGKNAMTWSSPGVFFAPFVCVSTPRFDGEVEFLVE
jgi:hypothetical protein